MKLSKRTKDAAREALGRMADEEIEKRMRAELGALAELLVGAYIIQHAPGATADNVQRARLESTALLGDIDHEAAWIAEWCATGTRPGKGKKKGASTS